MLFGGVDWKEVDLNWILSRTWERVVGLCCSGFGLRN
jgi:hypothetical protein